MLAGSSTACAYRGTEGCKCAAGSLIPDDRYSPMMETRGVSDDQPAGIVLAELGYDLRFVGDLQIVHDDLSRYWTPVSFRHQFLEFARMWGLSPLSVLESA